jgi:endonuclease III
MGHTPLPNPSIARPRLQQLAASNPAKTVKDLSREAFDLLSKDATKVKEAVAKLEKSLKGVGPATASAVLAAHR